MKHPITTRKQQSGSVLFWIVVIYLILSLLVPVVLWLANHYSQNRWKAPGDIEWDPIPRPLSSSELKPAQGLTGKIDDDAADSSGTEEPKPESENETAEQTVQP